MVYVLSFGARQHGDGITAVVFVKAARWHPACSAHHAWGKHAGHGVVVLEEAWVELRVKVSKTEFEKSEMKVGTILKADRLIRERRGVRSVLILRPESELLMMSVGRSSVKHTAG